MMKYNVTDQEMKMMAKPVVQHYHCNYQFGQCKNVVLLIPIILIMGSRRADEKSKHSFLCSAK